MMEFIPAAGNVGVAPEFADPQVAELALYAQAVITAWEIQQYIEWVGLLDGGDNLLYSQLTDHVLARLKCNKKCTLYKLLS